MWDNSVNCGKAELVHSFVFLKDGPLGLDVGLGLVLEVGLVGLDVSLLGLDLGLDLGLIGLNVGLGLGLVGNDLTGDSWDLTWDFIAKT